MADKMNISWTVSIQSAPAKGGSLDHPEWQKIEEKLLLLLENAGTVTLDTEDQHGYSRSLQVRAEGGKFVVMLGIETDADWTVRTYMNSSAQSENITILGDIWSDRIVCNDVSLVMAVFDEFFRAGDVSEDLLS